MPVGSWPYDDLGALVADRAGGSTCRAARRRVHPTGGETPIRVLDAAAARIAAGDARVVLIAGAEGTRAATRARRNGAPLPWTPAGAPLDLSRRSVPELERARSPSASAARSTASRSTSTRSVPTRAAASTTPRPSRRRCGRVSPTSPPTTRTRGPAPAPTRLRSASVGPDNRMVSYPYPKALTANPFVNQGAALLVTDTETARLVAACRKTVGCTRSAGRAPTSRPTPARGSRTTGCRRSTRRSATCRR